jgi:hypothetical protein
MGSKMLPVRRAGNLVYIYYKPIASTVWDPWHLTTLQASRACYGDSNFYSHKKQQTHKLRGLSPRANYTDRATAAYRGS